MDTQKKNFHFIPNALYDILQLCKTIDIESIKKLVDSQEIIEEYFLFLKDKNLGINVDSLKCFPEINLHYDSPRKIADAIIEISPDSSYDIKSLLEQLSDLNVEAIEFHFLSNMDIYTVCDILTSIQSSPIRMVTLYIQNDGKTDLFLEKIKGTYLRVKNIVFYNSPKDSNDYYKSEDLTIIYIKQKSISAKLCGNISFNFNLDTICEAQLKNICLNKKLSIAWDGSIGNCLGCSYLYGNVRTTRLAPIVESSEFQKIWCINKDMIEVCKDCEFRYVCFDCRVHITNKDNILSKPLQCTYNPYNNTWNN